MFVALYEFKVKPGRDEEFKSAWHVTTQGIYHEFGSMGSRLHTTEKPHVFIGYAQWPSKEIWASEKGELSNTYDRARKVMKNCIESSRVLYEMEVSNDYLHSVPFKV